MVEAELGLRESALRRRTIAAGARASGAGGSIGDFLQRLADLPPVIIYVVIGVGAALENMIPPIPADTFVLLGAFLAGGGRASVWLVFLCTWVPNVVTALLVYGLAHRYGRAFFATPAGHWLLRPNQLERIGGFYRRWGVLAILISRFLPAFRAIVPVFAGVTHVPVWKVAPAVALASGLWYGILVHLAAIAGRNLDLILALFDRVSVVLLIITGGLLLALLVWWIRSRRVV